MILCLTLHFYGLIQVSRTQYKIVGHSKEEKKIKSLYHTLSAKLCGLLFKMHFVIECLKANHLEIITKSIK